MTLEDAEEATMLQELEEFGTPRPFLLSFFSSPHVPPCVGARLILEEHSELVNKGLHPMTLTRTPSIVRARSAGQRAPCGDYSARDSSRQDLV